MSDSRITVEWALRKVKVRPEVFLKSHDKEFEIGLTYLSRNALKFNTKKEAEDYARCLYQDTGIAWEPVASLRRKRKMKKKPFNKDIPSFIRDDKNWVTVWHSPEAKLRIDRLKYTTITRLVREQVVRPYSKEPEQDVLAYDFNVKKWFNELMRFNHTYIETQPSQAAVIQAVNSHWGTVNDDFNGGNFSQCVDGVNP